VVQVSEWYLSSATSKLSMAILHAGTVVYENAYGMADLEHAVPVARDSPFKIASLTKPITAILQMYR
jgi:CubicO group peptidase (beta-lactamase class C family)